MASFGSGELFPVRNAMSHRIVTHLDAVSVVNLRVEDAVGHCRITGPFVPADYGQLLR